MSDIKKVIINDCYGGYSYSDQAVEEYCRIKNIPLFKYKFDFTTKRYVTDDNPGIFTVYFRINNINELLIPFEDNLKEYNKIYSKYVIRLEDLSREDKDLINIVKSLKDKASGRCGKLKIVKIPADVDYEIEDYDGWEHIAEKHRKWS